MYIIRSGLRMLWASTFKNMGPIYLDDNAKKLMTFFHCSSNNFIFIIYVYMYVVSGRGAHVEVIFKSFSMVNLDTRIIWREKKSLTFFLTLSLVPPTLWSPKLREIWFLSPLLPLIWAHVLSDLIRIQFMYLILSSNRFDQFEWQCFFRYIKTNLLCSTHIKILYYTLYSSYCTTCEIVDTHNFRFWFHVNDNVVVELFKLVLMRMKKSNTIIGILKLFIKI